jgi:starch synthase
MRVLFASSEIFPYAKSGGLADVADALPHAIKEFVEVSRVMPLYSFIQRDTLKKEMQYSIELSGIEYRCAIYSKDEYGVVTYFIKAPLLSSTKNMYGDGDGGYANNDLRFAVFCKAIVELCKKLDIEIVHLNDWHTALVALYIKDKKLNIKTLFTIHNLAYQGIFGFESLRRIGVSERYFTMDALEFYGGVNYLKAAIAYSDAITTVSPSYAKEILTQEFGAALDGFLKVHKNKLIGILNGINTDIFNPKTDKNIFCNFDKNSLENKYKNKVQFIKNSTLKDPRRPLFVMISRLVEQKGVDMLLISLKQLLEKKINLFVLGDGDEQISSEFLKLSKLYDNFEFFRGYDEGLSHKVYASGDFLLMPSRFEPCGLNQMISMSYATIPLVHSVGGLRDSVYEDNKGCGRGMVFEKFSKKEFLNAVDRALKLKKDKERFDEVRVSNLGCDFSFTKSALKYLEIYKKLLA